MECAICFDDIGPARVTLGCNHTFHVNCIIGWYYQQNMNCELAEEDYAAGQTASSCPCCRAVPANPLDDIPCARLIRFMATEEEDDEGAADSASDRSSTTLENPIDEEALWERFDAEEIAAAVTRTRADTPPPPRVPRLDLASLQVRWERTGPTSWERSIEVLDLGEEVEAEPRAWDGARTPSPPPDSLVEQAVDAARKIQALWRMRSYSRGRSRAAISL